MPKARARARHGLKGHKQTCPGVDLDFGEGTLPLFQRHLLDRDLLDDHEAPVSLTTVEVHNPAAMRKGQPVWN